MRESILRPVIQLDTMQTDTTASMRCPVCGSEYGMQTKEYDHYGNPVTVQWWGCPVCGPFPLSTP